MKVKIDILSKSKFETVMINNGINDITVEFKFKDCAFISIISPGDTPYFCRDHKNVINLVFSDTIETDDIASFNTGLATELINFIKQNEDKVQWYIHCSAGVSRSGAVGMFLIDYLSNVDIDYFTKVNCKIDPNSYVLGVLENLK